jgi:hypothetical protein
MTHADCFILPEKLREEPKAGGSAPMTRVLGAQA